MRAYFKKSKDFPENSFVVLTFEGVLIQPLWLMMIFIVSFLNIWTKKREKLQQMKKLIGKWSY